MAIGGGTFTVQNKVLPGAYINFVSTGVNAQMGIRGVVALPLELNWGPEGKVFKMTSTDFNASSLRVLGYNPTSKDIILIREALKRAKEVLVYRVNGGGTKATATAGGLTVEALYGGTRANDLKVAVQTNVVDETKFDVITYLGTNEVDKQTVETASELVANEYVTFTGEELSVVAPTALEGGANKEVTAQEYTDALNALEVESFNTIGYTGDDEAIKALYGAFVKRMREDEGRKIVGVMAGYAGDHIGLINVKNGVILSDGNELTAGDAVAWVAGASAGAEVNESLTNTVYEDAVDVTTKYTKSVYEKSIQDGEFVFYADNGRVRVLTDINSRVTIGQNESRDWTSNRVVRVMDGWANDVARIFTQSYIGLVTNSDTGRSLFKADLVHLARQYEEIDAISDFKTEDVTVIQGVGKRDVQVDCALIPNDSMEKLYMTVVVN